MESEARKDDIQRRPLPSGDVGVMDISTAETKAGRYTDSHLCAIKPAVSGDLLAAEGPQILEMVS